MICDFDKVVIISAAVIFMSVVTAWAQKETPTVYPTAIFPFVERGSDVKGYGEKATDILFANLAARPEIILVERAEIEKILGEAELGLSGIITPDKASKVGKKALKEAAVAIAERLLPKLVKK